MTSSFVRGAEQSQDRLAQIRWALELLRRDIAYRDAESIDMRLGEVLEGHDFDDLDPADRPYLAVARVHAVGRRPAEIRRLQGEWLASAAGHWPWQVAEWAALIAVAEQRWEDAGNAFVAANATQSYGPLYLDPNT